MIPRRHTCVILFFSVVLLAPAFLLGAGGVDLHCQSLWVKFFSAQFWHGNLYPRWLEGLNAGDGSPVFFYYPPLTYFITALFIFLPSGDVFGYAPIAASAWLAVFLSGITCYFWIKRETQNAEAALVASLLYMAAPTHIAMDFYYSLLFSSVWAFVWIPLLMIYAKDIANKSSISIAGFALSLGLLILTNIPMTIMFGPVAVIYALIHVDWKHTFIPLRNLAVAIVLGFGLASISLLPSVAYLHYATVDLHWNIPAFMGGDYHKRFLLLGFGSLGQSLYTLYWFACLLLAIFYFRAAPKGIMRTTLLTISLVALLMILSISAPLWEIVGFLKLLQIPLRMFAVLAFTLSLLAALTFTKTRFVSYSVIGIYTVVAIATALQTRVTPESFQKETPRQYKEFTLAIDQYANYLTSYDLFARFYTWDGIKQVEQQQAKTEVLSGDAQVTVDQWQPRHIALNYKVKQASTVRIHQFDYPGFTATIGSQALNIKRDEDTGRILLKLPPGSGTIELDLLPLMPEIAGEFITLFSAAIILLLGLISFRRKTA